MIELTLAVLTGAAVGFAAGYWWRDGKRQRFIKKMGYDPFQRN